MPEARPRMLRVRSLYSSTRPPWLMATLPATWTEPYRVRSYETDPRGCLTIQSLCDYLQEAAGNHAEALNVSVERLTPLGLAWVLARLRVQVVAYPRWRDAVEVLTWPSGEDRLYATREFLLHGQDGTVLARASSAWLLMHAERKRPVRLPDFIKAINLPERARPLAAPAETLKPPSRPGHAQRFRVRYSDLDLNAHVNNARYVEWVAESVTERILRRHQITSLDIQYRAETHFGAVIHSRTQQTLQGDTLEFAHDLTTEDDRRVALARTRWTPSA